MLDVKTARIYSHEVANRLINVRLTPEDERIVAQLKARGVSISEVMRRALRAEAEERGAQSVDAEGLLAGVLAAYPTPKEAPRRAVRASDRHAVRKHIQGRLRAQR